MAESKSRLLYILKYLWQNTDAEHYATTADILAFLKGNGISCDRKTIPGDIAKLCDIGIDIEEERSRENRYSLSSHLFTLPRRWKSFPPTPQRSPPISTCRNLPAVCSICTTVKPKRLRWSAKTI